MALRTFLLLASTAAFLLYLDVQLTEAAASEGLVSFPYEKKPCGCSSMKCACCQGIVVNPINLEKRICLNYTLSIKPLSLGFKIVLDNTVIAEFSVNPLLPPNYCIPVPLPDLVGMCVKINDVKLVSTLWPTTFKICSIFYVNYKTDKIFDYQFPCVNLGTDGISLIL